MPFVRRHVYRRLKAAKQECDKELQRVTNSITAFFEERLRDNDHEQEFEREQREGNRERDRESRAGDVEPLREPFVLQPAALRSALQFDEVSSDGGYEAEPEGSTSRGRQRAFTIQTYRNHTYHADRTLYLPTNEQLLSPRCIALLPVAQLLCDGTRRSLAKISPSPISRRLLDLRARLPVLRRHQKLP